MTQETIPRVRSIAIIGSGPSGAGALKALIKENKFDKIQAFEKRSNFGGLWNFTPETDIATTPIPSEKPTLDIQPVLKNDKSKYVFSSPVYNYMDTNVPRDIMTYAGSEFPKNTAIFPHRSVVWKYMTDYCQELTPYVKFDTKVVHVELQADNRWKVTYRTVCADTKGAGFATIDNPDVEEIYDAVIIANGNYDVPFIPNRPGMEEWNEKHPNSIMHVKAYRQPEDYTDLKGEILIVGNSASGSDLAFQLCTGLNRQIYKSKRSESLLPAGKSDKIIDKADIKRFDAETKLVEFVDGTTLENVDLIIFATGYLKSYPFLLHLNNSAKPLLTDGFRVHGNYKHLILYNYPNLALMGLARCVLPARVAETQGCWLAKVWAGKIALPSYDEMKQWEDSEVARSGNGTRFHDFLFPQDVHYCNVLINQVLDSVKDEPLESKGLIPRIWDKKQTSLRGSLKKMKDAHYKYKEDFGTTATSYQQLLDAKIIDSVLFSDEKLAEFGFKF